MDSIQYENLKKRILKYLNKNLKESRLKHTFNVAETAVKMAEREGEDLSKAEIAALMHDMAKNISNESINIYIKKLGLPKWYEGNINLAHSKIGEFMARTEFGICDDDILNAISYHTTGRAGMSALEKIIFLADAIEPSREYPGVDEIRAEAEKNINKACLLLLTETIDFINSKGAFLDTDTLKAEKYFRKMEENE